MKKITLIASAVALSLGGCASIINDKNQTVNVTTSNGAKISGTVNGQNFSAPGVVSVVREKQNKVFETSAVGCTPKTVAEKSVDPVFFINILSGGTFGSSTDFATEKMWRYSENVIINCK